MIHRFETTIAGRVLSLEAGRVAEQANGAVLVRYGDTVVLATATASNAPREPMHEALPIGPMEPKSA